MSHFGDFEHAHPNPARAVTNEVTLRIIDAHNAHDVAAVAMLHRELLPGSPVAALGDAFMRRFYYGRLVEDGLIGCHLAANDDDSAGFLSWTLEPELGSAIIRRHPIPFALAIARALITSPARVGVLLKLARFSRMRAPSTVNTSELPAASTAAASTAAVAPRTGELLSLAVRAAFRTREYRRVTNRKHSVELLQAGVAALHAGGVERFGAYVEHDNVPMLRLTNRSAVNSFESQGR